MHYDVLPQIKSKTEFCNINQNLKNLMSNAITNKNIEQVIFLRLLKLPQIAA